MKFISITKSINIRPDWATIGARLKAGTPLDITGAVANSSAAVGILADDAEKSSAEVAVVTEGSIDLAEITASYGELEDDCIAAIKGIAFIGSDGNPIVPSGGGCGGGAFIITVTPNDDETELSVDKTYQEIASAFAEGKTFYFYYPQYSTPFAASYVGADDGGFEIHGVYVDVEAVAEDMADIAVRTIHVIAGSTSGIMAYSEFSVVTGTYSSIPPVEL